MRSGDLTGLMFVVFVTLKLTGHIDWSWWLVTSPIWGVVVFALTMGLLHFVGGLVVRKLETPNQRIARLFREMAEHVGGKR